jgi:hypothetical protein
VELLAADVRSTLAYGADNKIFFAPEKLEMIRLAKKSGNYAPLCEVNDALTVTPIITAPKAGDQPALRLVSGSTASSRSNAMSQKEPQRPARSRATSEASLTRKTGHQCSDFASFLAKTEFYSKICTR